MKQVVLLASLSLLLIGVTVAQTVSPNNSTAHPTDSARVSPAVISEHSGDSPTITLEEWRELHIAQQEALKANSALAAKSKQVAAKMRAFQDKLNAAMIKAYPDMAPIVAKLGKEHSITPPAPQTKSK